MAFIAGAAYAIKTVDQSYPVLDSYGRDTGRRQIVAGKIKRIRVTKPSVKREKLKFIEVLAVDRDKPYLQHVGSIAWSRAVQISH